MNKDTKTIVIVRKIIYNNLCRIKRFRDGAKNDRK